MLVVAGGIILAVLLLMLLPLLLRTLLAIIPIGVVAVIGAFFLASELGRSLLPAFIAACLIAIAIVATSRILDRRDERRVVQSGWRRFDR